MFPIGHIGGATLIGHRFTRREDIYWLWIGALLPDLIDKPLYYFTHIELISGSRTFGHTALFGLALLLLGFLSRSPRIGALALGAVTHVALDHVSDVLFRVGLENYRIEGLLWPFAGQQFPLDPYSGWLNHSTSFFQERIWVPELLGLIGMTIFLVRGRARPLVRRVEPKRGA